MGDAEKISEDEILNKGYDVRSDLIKIGHHGSSSSTSDKFLKAKKYFPANRDEDLRPSVRKG